MPDDVYRLPRGGLIAAVVLGCTVAVGLLAWTLARSSDDHHDAGCPPALTAHATDLRAAGRPVAVFVDVPSNAPWTAASIARDIAPAVEDALVRGRTLTLVRDAGADSALATSPCFDGTRTYKVDFENPTRQALELERAVAGAIGHVQGFVEGADVAAHGGPGRLLREAVGMFGDDNDTDIYVWSDFVSNGPDCLNTDGQRADFPTIEAIRRRCAEMHAFAPVRGRITLLGVGTTPRVVGFEAWARDLALLVCRDISAQCEIGRGARRS